MEPATFYVLPNFWSLGENLTANFLGDDDVAPVSMFEFDGVVGVWENEHGDDAQLVPTLE